MTTEDRHPPWRTIIDNQAAGGMNIAAYCPGINMIRVRFSASCLRSVIFIWGPELKGCYIS